MAASRSTEVAFSRGLLQRIFSKAATTTLSATERVVIQLGGGAKAVDATGKDVEVFDGLLDRRELRLFGQGERLIRQDESSYPSLSRSRWIFGSAIGLVLLGIAPGHTRCATPPCRRHG